MMLAEAHEIYNAALAWRSADLEFQQADNLDTAGFWRDEAQDALNVARANLAALCDTRLRPYEATR
jgi:hypothetical protein